MGQNKEIALIEQRSTSLEVWGDRPELREMADRIKTMLPYGVNLEQNEALALAQASHLTKLNPFEGEIYFLKNPKTGESKGVYTGIKGRRRKAREQLYRQVGKGANFWIEYEFATAEWKTANNYDPQATVCIATLRDTGTINEYVRIVTALVAARMSAADIKAIAGDRPFVTGIGFVKPGEYLVRPLREVAKKRAERAALAQRFDIGLEIKSDDQADDSSDDSVSDLDTDGPDWDAIASADHGPVTLENGKRQLGRDDGDLTGAVDEVVNKAIADNTSNGKVDRDAVIVQANRELIDAGLKDDKPASVKTVTQASIKTNQFPAMIVKLQEATAYYNGKDGKANNFHVLKSAAKIGYTEITAENIDNVLRDLIQHAAENLVNVPSESA